MSDATRRGFLVFAGAGTAAAVGAVAVPKILGERPGAAAGGDELQAADLATAESFVVHVKDVKSGELAILVGDREVLLTDRELAARLAGVATA
ncbi:twin-arginine translocation signal domain-containing protein [Kribbella pratensis]|uniref:Secreted protein n=1 Tax=Kribbella pratensis TaxID=2512112 RepID=A0A4R8CMN7_9ACTN|nr:twin-arginine translocation signal domain-containing protein [Kribbella pratensis]TDW77314.1 secreted protein [Kribbella pratensis]